MKWLFACLLVLSMTAPAIAGGPYIAVVGNDIDANPFYLSPKYQQFLNDQGSPPGDSPPGEAFNLQNQVGEPEACDRSRSGQGNLNALLQRGNFEWTLNLPKTPSGEINLCIQCGVLLSGALDEDVFILSATASPGAGNLNFRPFNLTAFKNPGIYSPTFQGPNSAIANDAATQVLDGSTGTRVLLKSCMDKCIVAKLPVTGQVNAMGQLEHGLVAGDQIKVTLGVPFVNNRVLSCHQESLKVMGIGE